MKRRTYKYIERLVNRITKADHSLNDSFSYYHRQVVLNSGLQDFCVVIVTETDACGFGNTLEFDVDYMTKKVRFQSTQCRRMTEKVIEAFTSLYDDFAFCFAPYYKDEKINPELAIPKLADTR